MVQDTSKIKEKIISFLKRNGPSLPIHIAREIGSNMLFSSAFLSELVSEKKVKISNLKVGSSPLYYIQGHEPLLEKSAHYLKSKEKEAFMLLQEKRFLPDSSQEPAIRVALREIRDFAIPFKNQDNGEIVWRFFTVPESEFVEKTKDKPEKQESIVKKLEELKQEDEPKQETKVLDIFEKTPEKSKPEKKPKQPVTKKSKRSRKTGKKENVFFDKLKESLAKKSIEILDVESFSKNEIVIKSRENNEEKIIFAFNKKRITDRDIIKAGKKASNYGLPYKIVSLGEPLKKVNELIGAIKDLSSVEKL